MPGGGTQIFLEASTKDIFKSILPMKKCESDLTYTGIKIRKSYLLKSVINSLYFNPL
jgi:hypothetical protein